MKKKIDIITKRERDDRKRENEKEDREAGALGGDSCSEGRGFESMHHILDLHLFTYICFKNCNVCLNRRK